MKFYSSEECIALMLIATERSDVVTEIEKHCKDQDEVDSQILAFAWLIDSYAWDYQNPDHRLSLIKKFYKEVDGVRYPDWINIKGVIIELQNMNETGWMPPE